MAKLIINVEQMKRLLAIPEIQPKYPITVKMKNVSKADLKELVELLKKKKG
jgi:ATP-dependent protease HslVU (ClpYQ) ATPase subunit